MGNEISYGQLSKFLTEASAIMNAEVDKGYEAGAEKATMSNLGSVVKGEIKARQASQLKALAEKTFPGFRF